jgi:hypothetical protein
LMALLQMACDSYAFAIGLFFGCSLIRDGCPININEL